MMSSGCLLHKAGIVNKGVGKTAVNAFLFANMGRVGRVKTGCSGRLVEKHPRLKAKDGPFMPVRFRMQYPKPPPCKINKVYALGKTANGGIGGGNQPDGLDKQASPRRIEP